MCGIVGYIGNQSATEILTSGLTRLEYRGYDSAGVAVLADDELQIERAVGRLSNLKDRVSPKSELQKAQVGIGHTRWATHGGPTEINAHPHRSQGLALVHNGIVENYQIIRRELEEENVVFSSETDTEVAAHLLAKFIYTEKLSYAEALEKLIAEVEGSFAFVACLEEEPDVLLVARRNSPLVIGVGEGEYFVASDVTALLEYTRQVIYLEDNDYAVIKRDQLEVYAGGVLQQREVKTIKWDLDQAQKGGYEHFLIKEIHDQPKAVNDTLSGRLTASHQDFRLPEFAELEDAFKELERVKLISCGTAWHASLLGKHYLELLARVPADVEVASEFRYSNPIVNPKDIVIAVSQSGETADTLAALKLAMDKCLGLGVTNVLGSSLDRTVKASILTQAGPEISVASTKAFVTQALVLFLFALHTAKAKGQIQADDLAENLADVSHLSSLIAETLKLEQKIAEIAQKYLKYESYFFIGRGSAYPIALEGALKLKELTYLSAQGYAAGELKHGPLALVTDQTPCVVVLPETELLRKTLSSLEEIKARGAPIIALTDATDTKRIGELADHILTAPQIDPLLQPIVLGINLQLLAYYTAVALNRDVDQPRNLAKSVTVECSIGSDHGK